MATIFVLCNWAESVLLTCWKYLCSVGGTIDASKIVAKELDLRPYAGRLLIEDPRDNTKTSGISKDYTRYYWHEKAVGELRVTLVCKCVTVLQHCLSLWKPNWKRATYVYSLTLGLKNFFPL